MSIGTSLPTEASAATQEHQRSRHERASRAHGGAAPDERVISIVRLHLHDFAAGQLVNFGDLDGATIEARRQVRERRARSGIGDGLTAIGAQRIEGWPG